MMNFELFAKLYREALECENVEYFIAELGWQDWMESYAGPHLDGEGAAVVTNVLFKIFTLSRMSITEMRESIPMSRAAFCRLYTIPSSTVQDWDYGNVSPAIYLKKLIAYTIFQTQVLGGPINN